MSERMGSLCRNEIVIAECVPSLHHLHGVPSKKTPEVWFRGLLGLSSADLVENGILSFRELLRL